MIEINSGYMPASNTGDEMKLSDIANAYNASIDDYHKDLKVFCLYPEKYPSNVYFSGHLVRYIDVFVDGSGLNKTGKWPFLLVNDEGRMKILAGC